MREVVIQLWDDLEHHRKADETIEFTFEGQTYTVDLCAENAEKLRSALKPYMVAAHDITKAGGITSKAKNNKGSKVSSRRTEANRRNAEKLAIPNPELRREIRQWAKENGFRCSATGMIPKVTAEAYAAYQLDLERHSA